MSKQTSELESRLISILADGAFHSGPSLAHALGVTRAAINKRINSLEGLQLDIYRVSGRGYRLAKPLQLLNEERLADTLGTPQVPLLVEPITTSTQDDLKNLLADSVAKKQSLPAGTAVLAEVQQHGRGRRGKAWASPFGSNLYLSMYWPLPQGLTSASGLSIATGVWLATELQQAGINDVSVKWPNDVYVNNKKIAGILVELEGQQHDAGHALIGVGLNLDLSEQQANQISQPFTSVQRHLHEPISRHDWAVRMIAGCRRTLRLHEQQGLDAFIADWQRLDKFYKQPVRLLLGQHEHVGIAEGIDETGALLVRHGKVLKRYFSGEISVREPS